MGAVNAKDEELADLIAELDLKHDKQLADLKAELTEELSGKPDEMDISQNVNIDLDLGDLPKDDSPLQDFNLDGINMDWWHYALIGLGFIAVLMVKCLIMDRGQSQLEDRAGLLPF